MWDILALFRRKRDPSLKQLARELYEDSEVYWAKFGPEFSLPWNETTEAVFLARARDVADAQYRRSVNGALF
jgi:hypothetical protein